MKEVGALALQDMLSGKQPAGDPEFCQIQSSLMCCRGTEQG